MRTTRTTFLLAAAVVLSTSCKIEFDPTLMKSHADQADGGRGDGASRDTATGGDAHDEPDGGKPDADASISSADGSEDGNKDQGNVSSDAHPDSEIDGANETDARDAFASDAVFERDGGLCEAARPFDAARPTLVCQPPPDAGSGLDWIGCSATCGVCELWADVFDLYELHHPQCHRSTVACEGAWAECSADCPIPSEQDTSCNSKADGWSGCRGSGCTVIPELVAAYPNYFKNHGLCRLAGSSGDDVRCNGVCPAPGPQDQIDGNGSPGGWNGCRGYGLWVCTELVNGYPRYFINHPLCQPNPTCHGWSGTCNSACPAPGPQDRDPDPPCSTSEPLPSAPF
jgi:hypothetical protein